MEEVRRNLTLRIAWEIADFELDLKDDNRYNFQLQDPTLDPDDFFILSVFSQTRLELPNQLLPGSVLLIRDIWVSRINSRY
jgi:hypothetical protein